MFNINPKMNFNSLKWTNEQEKIINKLFNHNNDEIKKFKEKV